MSVIIKELQFSYDEFILKAGMDIKKGEFLSILGPSGSGKTTLLRLLAGFITPEKGSITLGGRDITRIRTSERNIGMVFQDYALFPHLDVYHNIAYGLKSHKYSREKIKKRVTGLLALVKLSGYEKRSITELSGGEKQRIALARAIAPEPDLLLFDEPLSALDVKLRKQLRREIVRIQRELGFTAIYVTHDQEEAMSVSDRIAVMNKGMITQIGSPEELYNKPADFFTADFIGTMNRVDDIMFRPEACKIISDERNISSKVNRTLDVTVESSEYAGGYYICEGKLSDNVIIIFFSDKYLENGSPIQLELDHSKIMTCC